MAPRKKGVDLQDVSKMVVFVVDRQRFAVRLGQVDRVVSAAEVTPLPGAPSVVAGVIDLAGEIVPVYDMRQRFRASSVQPCVRASDQFLILKRQTGRVALVIQESTGIFDLDLAVAAAPELNADEPGWFEGTTRLGDDLVLVHDIERFLSAQESGALQQALAGADAA